MFRVYKLLGQVLKEAVMGKSKPSHDGIPVFSCFIETWKEFIFVWFYLSQSCIPNSILFQIFNFFFTQLELSIYIMLLVLSLFINGSVRLMERWCLFITMLEGLETDSFSNSNRFTKLSISHCRVTTHHT